MAVKTKINLKNLKRLVPKVRREFSRRGPRITKRAILTHILRGVSPVEGEGGFDKYSDSYKDLIRTGKLEAGKKVSPVNLRLKGGLLRSLFVDAKGGLLKKFRMEIGFTDFLADIHNRQGVGLRKIIRRILPTGSGEQFTRRINSTILLELQKSVRRVIKKFR